MNRAQLRWAMTAKMLEKGAELVFASTRLPIRDGGNWVTKKPRHIRAIGISLKILTAEPPDWPPDWPPG